MNSAPRGGGGGPAKPVEGATTRAGLLAKAKETTPHHWCEAPKYPCTAISAEIDIRHVLVEAAADLLRGAAEDFRHPPIVLGTTPDRFLDRLLQRLARLVYFRRHVVDITVGSVRPG